MKILTVISYYYPALTYGGPAKVAFDLCIELSKKNEVTVYTTDVWDEKRRIKENEKLQSTDTHKIKYFPNIVNSFAYKYRFFTGFGLVFDYFKNWKKYDVVHIHDVFIIPQILLGYLSIVFNKEYVVSPHGVLDPVRVEDKSTLKSIVYKMATPVLKHAKMLIATSDDECEVLKDLGFAKVKTVYNGVDIMLTRPSTKYSNLDKEDVITFLYVGKIHKLKGLSEFVDAVSKVKYNYQVIIAGPDDGGKKELLRKVRKNNIKENVHFIDFVDEGQKSELFEIADLFIYPSYSEGFSIAIIEALKYSVPVLITDECNFDDVVKHKAGFTVNVNDLQKNIYNDIKDIDKKTKKLKNMSLNGRKLLEEKYSISIMAQKVQKIYES